MVYCAECGGIISSPAKFCTSCGIQISTFEEHPTSIQKEQIKLDTRDTSQMMVTKISEQNRKNIILGFGFLCLYLIFKPGFLGLSIFDLHSAGNDDASFQIIILGLIALSCFFYVFKVSKKMAIIIGVILISIV